MITAPDFAKKQIVFVFFSDGEKMAISNDNLVVKNKDGTIKFQCTCYRLFLVFAVGSFSITSAVIQKAKKFGFFIACMTAGFRVYNIIGGEKEGNTLLKRKQYAFSGNGIACSIVKNKLMNQRSALMSIRRKNELMYEAISHIDSYRKELHPDMQLNEIMAYEGMAAKVYFRAFFDNVPWKGRQPRLKRDYVNSALDVGYSVLFTFIDCIAQCYGFDTYVGVMHRQFYMRKSLVCDLVEPFRPLVDTQLKKSINLKQIKEDDFMLVAGQWRLKHEKSTGYARLFLETLVNEKERIFAYIQAYYYAFMKGKAPEEFPQFSLKGDC